MVKYAIIANIIFDNITDRKNMKTSLPTISNKPIWEKEQINESNDIENNKPILTIDIKFENEDDMHNYYNMVKEMILTSNTLKNTIIYKYLCHHDVIPFRPCEIIEEYMIKDVHR